MNCAMQQLNSSESTKQMKFTLNRLVLVAMKRKMKKYVCCHLLSSQFLVKEQKAQLQTTQQNDDTKLFIWNHLSACFLSLEEFILQQQKYIRH